MIKQRKFKTTIGGQALIEGVMMRGPNETAMAVRLPDGTIEIEMSPTSNPSAWYRKAPFIRGSFNMMDSLLQGYKCLMRSAEKSGMEEEPGNFEKWLAEKSGKSLANVVSAVAIAVAGAIAIGLFMVLPAFLTGLFGSYITNSVVKSLVEGAIKITIFVLYLVLVSNLSDIKRVFQYHGAEHKTIACYEAGEELTVENARRKARFHPRCGTSFLLIVLIISILVFSAVTWSSVVLRVALKLLTLPVVIGIAYEIIKLAGRYDNIATRIISAPGMWFQRLTTLEPDDSQLEVAIASLIPVIPEEKGSDDW